MNTERNWGFWTCGMFVQVPKLPLTNAGYTQPPFSVELPDGSTRHIVEESYEVVGAGAVLQVACHNASVAGGWHAHRGTGVPFTEQEQDDRFPTRIALCHSELSEALEGHRKGVMDDHLPHRPMAEVELADAVIRIFDLAGAMGYELGGAIAEKLDYNARRRDHKVEVRNATGGKRY